MRKVVRHTDVYVRAEREYPQGDVNFIRVAALPESVTRVSAERDRESGAEVYIIAHSETGHHHVVDATEATLFASRDPLVGYLVLDDGCADIVHQRSWDTHGTIGLTGGVGAVWEVRRQREYDPAGERRAAD